MKRLALVVFAVISLSGCGDFNDRTNNQVVELHKRSCLAAGYHSVSVTYIMGMASSNYTCIGKN